MIDLCNEHDIPFYVILAPIMNIEESRDLSVYNKSICDNGLSEILNGYVESIIYYSDECFSDGVHFTSEYLEEYREEVIKKLPDIISKRICNRSIYENLYD